MLVSPGSSFSARLGTIENEFDQAELREVSFAKGRLVFRTTPSRRVFRCFAAPQAQVLRCPSRRSVLFFHSDAVVAELTDAGNLLIRGDLRVHTTGYTGGPGPFFYSTASGLLFLPCTNLSSPAGLLAFDVNGNLFANRPFSERSAIEKPAPACAGASGSTLSRYGGSPADGGAALIVSPTAIALRGTLTTNHSFQG